MIAKHVDVRLIGQSLLTHTVCRLNGVTHMFPLVKCFNSILVNQWQSQYTTDQQHTPYSTTSYWQLIAFFLYLFTHSFIYFFFPFPLLSIHLSNIIRGANRGLNYIFKQDKKSTLVSLHPVNTKSIEQKYLLLGKYHHLLVPAVIVSVFIGVRLSNIFSLSPLRFNFTVMQQR